MLLAWIVLIACLAIFFLRFEFRKTTARDITLIAAMTAIASIGRVIFSPIPSAQPTSFIVITSAIVFGPETGLIIGALSALTSNVFLGQGPWTPWQMLSWGLMGLGAGMLFNQFKIKGMIPKVLYGLVSGFMFGMIMDLWYVSVYLKPFNLQSLIAGLSAGVPFNIIHAINNVIFIYLFSNQLEKTLKRIQIKYGVLAK